MNMCVIKTMSVNKYLYFVIVLIVVVCFKLVTVSGCLYSGLEFLSEEIFPAVCPLLSGTTFKLQDLFQSQSIGNVVLLCTDLIYLISHNNLNLG